MGIQHVAEALEDAEPLRLQSLRECCDGVYRHQEDAMRTPGTLEEV